MKYVKEAAIATLLIVVFTTFLIGTFGRVSIPNDDAYITDLSPQVQDDKDSVMGAHYKGPPGPYYFEQWFPSAPDGLFGIDVSKWQGTIDWQQAAAAGVHYAFIRLGAADSACNIYLDSQFERNSVEAVKVGIYVDYYWFFRPQCDPVAQATMFANNMFGRAAHMYPVIDVEVNGGRTPMQVLNAVQLFVNTVKEITGRTTMIYTSPGFWNGNVAPSSWAKTNPLWLACWGCNIVPNDWDDWVFHQYTVCSGCGPDYGMESSGLDLDEYWAGLPEFLDEFKCDEEPEPPCGECPEVIRVKVEYNDDTKVWTITLYLSDGTEKVLTSGIEIYIPIVIR